MYVKLPLKSWFYFLCCGNCLQGDCWLHVLFHTRVQYDVFTETQESPLIQIKPYISMGSLSFSLSLYFFLQSVLPLSFDSNFTDYQSILTYLFNTDYSFLIYLVQVLKIPCHLWMNPYHSLLPSFPPYMARVLEKYIFSLIFQKIF